LQAIIVQILAQSAIVVKGFCPVRFVPVVIPEPRVLRRCPVAAVQNTIIARKIARGAAIAPVTHPGRRPARGTKRK